VLEKLNLKDRVALTRYAIRRGLVEPWACSARRLVTVRS
jgi:hypothetical protein